jgi:hypothetical protein
MARGALGIQVFARRISDGGRRQRGMGRTDFFERAMLAHGPKLDCRR